MGEGLDESLRRRVETLSEKNEAKDSARDGLDVEDGSEVVCLRCSKAFVYDVVRRCLRCSKALRTATCPQVAGLQDHAILL